MKKWCCLLLLLLLLTGCGKQDVPASPYDLEVEYGDSGIVAEKAGYSWTYAGGSVEADAADPMERLSDIPFLNESKDKKINLLFSEKPDSLEISWRSSADGYKTLVTMEKSKTSFSAPADGASYLYLIHATWQDDESLGGSCQYWFRYLPKDATGAQTQEMSLYRVVQMEPEDLFGVEFLNNLDGQRKTCTSLHDREAVLDYLKQYLATNFVQIELPEEEADYVLRLAATMGDQVTLSYGGEGQNAWIMLDGVPYRAEVMDLYTLWECMETEPVSLYETENSDYLAVSETAPMAELECPVRLGYLQSMEDETVILKNVLWIEDAEEPNGYRLEPGDLATLSLTEDCQYWILDGHAGPWGQVERETLWQWAQTSGYDVLFCLVEDADGIIAIYEQYVP